jgi:hypothetical protein
MADDNELDFEGQGLPADQLQQEMERQNLQQHQIGNDFQGLDDDIEEDDLKMYEQMMQQQQMEQQMEQQLSPDHYGEQQIDDEDQISVYSEGELQTRLKLITQKSYSAPYGLIQDKYEDDMEPSEDN